MIVADIPSDDATLRRRAEEKAALLEAVGEEEHAPEEARLVLHDLIVHRIELEMQNDELRRAQEGLEAARARYFDLYDLAPVGYCTISEKGLVLEANLTIATMLGVARADFVRFPFSRYVFPEDQGIYYRHLEQLSEVGVRHACELRMHSAEATPFWASLETSAAQDRSGRRVLRAAISDITGRKRAEKAVQNLLAEKEVLLKEVHHRVKNMRSAPHFSNLG